MEINNGQMKGTGRFTRWSLDSVAPRYGESPNRGWRMLVNVFSNTTPPRVKAEGVSIVGLALSLFFMAAIVALAFVACAGL